MTRPQITDCDLRPFLAPASVALIGATEEVTRFGGRCLQRMIGFGYQGRIYPVNPKVRELQGLTCYPSVRELPEAPDHVGVVVPAERVLGILRECADRGIRFATIYTGGFAEAGTSEGQASQRAITAFARETGMRIMGPNCNGLINFVDGFAMTTTATIAGPRRPAGNVAVVAQSGGVGQVNVMWRAQELGIGISYEISCGNSADLDVIDFSQFLLDDTATDVILIVAEHLSDGERFMRMARLAEERQKPIVILKFGRTEAGSRAAASHTGAVTGSDIVQDAAFRQCGVIRVDDCNDLCNMAMLLRTRRWPRGTNAAATTVSGGNGVLTVDLAASLGIDWPEYGADTREKLTQLLPKLGTAANPTDVTNMAIGKPDIFRKCIETIAADERIDVTIPIFTMSQSNDIRQAAQAAKSSSKPVAILWTGGCNDDPSFNAATIAAEGVPIYRDTLSCLKTLRAAMRYGEFLGSSDRRKVNRPNDVDRDRARKVLRRDSGVLSAQASNELLASYGFPLALSGFATNVEEAIEIARGAAGAVAIKVESSDIPHKTDAGAVRLQVKGDDAVRLAFDEVMAAARRYKADARLDGVMVQEMIPNGLELMLGLVSDPIFGPVVVAGLGGIHVEVLKDIAHRIAPIGADEALAMLRELRGYRLLEGVRGARPADIDTLVDLIVRLSWLGHDFKDSIVELDINPLVLFEQGSGARVIDAMVIVAAPAGTE